MVAERSQKQTVNETSDVMRTGNRVWDTLHGRDLTKHNIQSSTYGPLGTSLFSYDRTVGMPVVPVTGVPMKFSIDIRTLIVYLWHTSLIFCLHIIKTTNALSSLISPETLALADCAFSAVAYGSKYPWAKTPNPKLSLMLVISVQMCVSG